jgi:nicotinamidase/pyrazinamidase
MSNIAILRVDVQESFTPEGGLPVAAGREVVDWVNRITENARRAWLLIIDSVDYHPEWHISFASAWNQEVYTQNPLNPSDPSDLLWPDHSIAGTKDVKLIDGIIDPENCIKIYKWWQKNRDAYSAFDMWVTALDWDVKIWFEISRGAKTLKQVLLHNQIQVLRIFGLVTEVCVKANVLDALEEWFDVEIIESATRWLSPEWHKQTLVYLSSLDGKRNRQGRIQSVKILS